ncbi:hypothetical protein PPACK8108_LOCUS19617 [Phakopsora pachyrhizi]|uniref:Uncharacterized protein n=1 Tax=Phakopsora pachyrhizi TaxID=170000 RepID=A0AAV0BF44_PHAPC|nr:hypothetical protein PPACK8108_LOCUS19617 [Phakopsora pachyrhizi]
MTPLENNTHLSSSPFPHPTVSLLCPIRSPPTFLNTNTGCITEHNERKLDDNSNDNREHNEEEDNDANEVNNFVKNQRGTSFFTTNFSILLHLVSVNQQLAYPNLKNYQGTLTNQDAIFDGENEVITKEAFLKNIMVANRNLSLVIDNPSLPFYIQGKVKEAIDLLHADEESMCSFFP